MNEKKEALQKLWNRVPVSLCEKLCGSFDENIEHVLAANGGRLPLNPPKKVKMYQKAVSFNKVWNESSPDFGKIVYNDKLLMEMKNKSIKRANKQRKKMDREFNKYARERWGIRNFVKNGPVLLVQEKLPNELKEEYVKLINTKKKFFDYVNEIENLDADQFFVYLSPTQRLKVINEKGKDLHLFNESSTNVDESNLDEDEISNSSMSLDQAQVQQSGMIIDEEDLD